MALNEFEDIVGDFDYLDDWDDRYRYIIDLGKKLTPLDEKFKNSDTKINGCASQVWLTYDISGEGTSKEIHFKGESDAIIVKGLMAILLTLFNGLRISEAKKVDALAKLDKLGLQDHLSAQRNNGLRAVIGKIRDVISAER